MNFARANCILLDMTAEPKDANDDWKTARRAVEGDTSTFKNSLYEKYSPDLQRFIASRLGQNGVEDLLSEVWLHVWRKIKESKYAESHFRGFIYTITRNLIIDRVRQQKTQAAPLGNNDFASPENSPDVAAQIHQKRLDLRDCHQQLQTENKGFAEIITGFLQGLSREEIIDQLKIPSGTYDSGFSRSKALLKKCMERKGWKD